MFGNDVKKAQKKASKAVIADTQPVEKAQKNKRPWYKSRFVFGTIGIALAFVWVSIAYMLVTIYLGTDSTESRIMMIPSAAFELVVAGYAFSKIFK